MKAYGWLYATAYGSGFLSQDPWDTGNASVGSDLAFNIVPRLPDGNSLTAGDVHLFNSVTAGTLAASRRDQPLYPPGSPHAPHPAAAAAQPPRLECVAKPSSA